MPNYLLFGALSLLLLGCQAPQKINTAPENGPKQARNVVLLIGDGMGLSQVSAALLHNGNKLNLEQFTTIGFHKTHSGNDLITDSAAGATAFSCGVKTYNGAIGVDMDTLPCFSILEEADSRGYATGLIASSTIVHATPAAFIAHQPIRINYEEIAEDFLKTDIDLFIGGGKRYFDRREKDERDLYLELQKKGYIVSDYYREPLNGIMPHNKRNFAYFTADKHPLTYSAGRDYMPYATAMALSFLRRKSEKGFFLMVESSQIDWGGHANDGSLIVDEMLDFDKVVETALKFARKDGETLLIVTADHESGGLALNPSPETGQASYAFTTNGHTAAMVPVFAYGPGAELFSGIYENTDIYHKMKKAMNLGKETSSASP